MLWEWMDVPCIAGSAPSVAGDWHSWGALLPQAWLRGREVGRRVRAELRET